MSISISGLEFIDSNYQVPRWQKFGAPDIAFGSQYMENTRPLPFIYLASDSVSSFKAVKVSTTYQVIAEYDKSTSLITSDGTYHVCDGLTDFVSSLECGFYYFIVNNRYVSDIVRTEQLDNDPWILEEGFWNDKGVWKDTELWNDEPEIL